MKKPLALTLISALLISLLLVASVPSLRAVTEAPQVQWEKTYGYISGISIVEITDEGYEGFLIAAEKGDEYYYVGHGATYYTNERNVLIKTDLGGHVHWMKDLSYEVSRMIPAEEGGFTIAGYRKSGSHGGLEVVLAKIDVEGTDEWTMAYAQGDAVAHITFLIQTQDGGYVLGGYINLQPNAEVPDEAWVLKADSSGNLQWNSTYGGNSDDPPNRILSSVETVDGGFVCVGNVDGASLVQIDALGNLQFTKTYSDISLNSVVKTNDDGYFFVGIKHEKHDWTYVMKTDLNLEFLWDRTYSVTYSLRALKDRFDDCYLLHSGGHIMKVDPSGNVEWSNKYPRLSLSLIQTEDRGFASIGSRNEGGVLHIWLVKIAPEPPYQQTEPPPPEPFPTTWLVIAVVIVVVIGLGLLVYFKKRHHNTGSC